VIGITTDRQTIKNLISFYLQTPITALWSSLLLIYNPPLLDILPMYVVFMLISPWILIVGFRFKLRVIISLSLAAWFCAQFGVEKEIYEAISHAVRLKGPYHETGTFNALAWQSIWILGLWTGFLCSMRRPGCFVHSLRMPERFRPARSSSSVHVWRDDRLPQFVTRAV
jgi:hypothetical protein